ncbi:hypothetical protein ACLMJK_001278 [Lecanora helva]
MQHSKAIVAVGAISFTALLLTLANTSWPYGSYKSLRSPFRGSLRPEATRWSDFAYVQYVTNVPYLCNSVMLFESLHRLGSQADRLLMYPEEMDLSPETVEGYLLVKAQDEYNAILEPIKIQQRPSADATWAESFTKLLAFNQTQYKRVLHLDSDATVLQSMDDLFLMPDAAVAMPRAYWLGFEERVLSSQLMLVEPSNHEFSRVLKTMQAGGRGDYDMEIVNTLYKDKALILPHRPYDLLTGEFSAEPDADHQNYLGDEEEKWNPDVVLEEAKYLHFSDWPMPKPWIKAKDHTVEEKKPKCAPDSAINQTLNCRNQKLWLNFYDDFQRRRKIRCDTYVIGSEEVNERSKANGYATRRFRRCWLSYQDEELFTGETTFLKFQACGVAAGDGLVGPQKLYTRADCTCVKETSTATKQDVDEEFEIRDGRELKDSG